MALTEIDRNLLTRCLNREPDAWKDFVDRFMGLVVHVVNHTAHARSIRLSQDDVDDLCADVFLGIVAKNFAVLRHFRQQSSLATYLAVVARRICVRQLARRKLAERLGHTLAHRALVPEALTSNPEQFRIDNAEEVDRMIDGLGPVEARVVRLFHVENKSYAQISAELDIPENSVGPILSRARARLRRDAARESSAT